MTPFEQYAAHFFVGFISSWIRPSWGGFLFCVFLGFGKELFDQWSYGGFDIIDLLFTVLGGILKLHFFKQMHI